MHSITLVVFGGLLLVAVSQAAPQFATVRAQPVPVSRDEVKDDAGQYSLVYTTGDGVTVTKQGVLKPNADNTDLVLVEYGKYSYTSPEGQLVKLEYTADETGFHPQSDSIPVQPVAAPAVFA